MADREAVLEELLDECHISWQLVERKGARHILIKTGSRGVDEASVVLMAHYDRASGSPGANDNSVAVLLLIEAAKKLREEGRPGDGVIILSDREEMKSGAGAESQGSFGLVPLLKGKNVFILDGAGSGDCLIISTLIERLAGPRSFPGWKQGRLESLLAQTESLRLRALDAAREADFPAMLLPVPFSDDAGLLAGGITGQTMTVLPRVEAEAWKKRLEADPDLEQRLKGQNYWLYRRVLPPTWQAMNTHADTIGRLSPSIYGKIVNLALNLLAGPVEERP
jgi:hypothetical protein